MVAIAGDVLVASGCGAVVWGVEARAALSQYIVTSDEAIASEPLT